MAVYTTITFAEASEWFDQEFNLGHLDLLEGIRGGIENSNYFFDAKQNDSIAHFVLTIFERLDKVQLPYYLNLMRHLSQNGIRVPMPIPNNSGDILLEIKDKPAVLVTKLEGSSQLSPSDHHCKEVGHMLAKMHLAGQGFKDHQENLRSLTWWKKASHELMPFIDLDKKQLLETELVAQDAFFASRLYQDLPSGACHCDLFRDNVLFKDNGELSGFFDFYFAGTDKWLFDVAVTANDWCIDLNTGEFDSTRLRALLHAYQKVRPFTPAEQDSWIMILRSAALRFWISRLWDFYIPRSAELLTPHDPTHFERILRLRIQSHAN
jgi:homoserine kinase type II